MWSPPIRSTSGSASSTERPPIPTAPEERPIARYWRIKVKNHVLGQGLARDMINFPLSRLWTIAQERTTPWPGIGRKWDFSNAARCRGGLQAR